MKSLLFSLVVTLFAFSSLQAQDFSYGVFAGYNLSKVNNLLGGEFEDNKSGFHAGAIAEFRQSEKWSFETSVAYSQEGEILDRDGQYGAVYLDFINVPIHAKYYITEGFSVHAGPQVGFLLDAEFEAEDGGDRQTIENKVNSSFAITGGLGYDFSNGLFIKGNFALGITDIIDNPELKNDERTRVGSLSIGYKF